MQLQCFMARLQRVESLTQPDHFNCPPFEALIGTFLATLDACAEIRLIRGKALVRLEIRFNAANTWPNNDLFGSNGCLRDVGNCLYPSWQRHWHRAPIATSIF